MSVIFILFITSINLTGCIDETNNNIEDNGQNFEITLIDGSKINLIDFRDKVVIMDLWATWCQPCASQMIELETLYNSYSRDNLEIISINIDTRETSQDIKDYIDSAKEYGYNFNWLFGNDDGNIWNTYQINGGIPTLYIFDKKGNIYYSAESYHSYSDIAKKIDELM